MEQKACPDCVEAEEILKEKGIQYLYMEFSDNIGYLKRFLTLRDTNPIFDEVKEKGFTLVPSRYIEFVNRDENIDFDTKMKSLQGELKELLSSRGKIQSRI